jgi:hypothetical protein
MFGVVFLDIRRDFHEMNFRIQDYVGMKPYLPVLYLDRYPYILNVR